MLNDETSGQFYNSLWQQLEGEEVEDGQGEDVDDLVAGFVGEGLKR
jgi:hypothetical protein